MLCSLFHLTKNNHKLILFRFLNSIYQYNLLSPSFQRLSKLCRFEFEDFPIYKTLQQSYTSHTLNKSSPLHHPFVLIRSCFQFLTRSFIFPHLIYIFYRGKENDHKLLIIFLSFLIYLQIKFHFQKFFFHSLYPYVD